MQRSVFALIAALIGLGSSVCVAEPAYRKDKDGALAPCMSYPQFLARTYRFVLNDLDNGWATGNSYKDHDGKTVPTYVHYALVNAERKAGVGHPLNHDTVYPAFHHALFIRGLLAHWRYAGDAECLARARRLADWNLERRTPPDWKYGSLFYSTAHKGKVGGSVDGDAIMTDKPAIMALAMLELAGATGDVRYCEAAESVAATLARTQLPGGNWPFRVNPRTGEVREEYTSSAIYALMLFEALKGGKDDRFAEARAKTLKWILEGPAKTMLWKGFYEDVSPEVGKNNRTNWDCIDTARWLVAHRADNPEYLPLALKLHDWIAKEFVEKRDAWAAAEGLREQKCCFHTMGIHTAHWAALLADLHAATGELSFQQRALQACALVTYWMRDDGANLVGPTWGNEIWFSCHFGPALYVYDTLTRFPDRLAAEGSTPLRWLRVELPGQEQNAVKKSWPDIGCWFWTAEEFKPDGYKRFLDLHEKHSSFGLLTTSIRHPAEVTDPKVYDQIKAAAVYARQRGMGIVMDLDVRLARQAYFAKYPDELQEIVRLREVALGGAGEVSLAVAPISLGDHYTFATRGYDLVSARLLRVYSYVAGPDGIEPDTVCDITSRCKAPQADAKGVRVVIPCTAEDTGRTACVLAAFSLFTPDVFAPHLVEFERDILKQYADVPLAGACKDEWGFPGRFGPRTDDLYYSRFMAEAYAARRPGHELERDLLRMFRLEKGRDGERAAAINHYMEMNCERNGAVETAFYNAVKEIFGQDALSATHPTWYAFPGPEEVFKNGLDWWAARRDLAQTDEAAPFCARTALAKKWHSPLWYNMYYNSAIKSYEEDLWRHALGGGRINFHPLWPHPWEKLTTSLLENKLLVAATRIGLLNYISTAPIDCPAAVIFGHPSAVNWPGPNFADVGLEVSNGLWKDGYYADLIPSSEIAMGNLKLAEDGSLQYGPQRYRAAVFYHPQFERLDAAEFFRKAAAREKTALFRVGDWTMDFEGRVLDADAVLPPMMKPVTAADAVQQIIARLKASGVEPQTPCTMRGAAGFPASMMPRPSGQCRLLDGTVIVASGEHDVLGDPLQKTIQVNGHAVAFDAIGVAAVRLDKEGKVQAIAAGGLKKFTAGDMVLELPQRVDLAMWRDAEGKWHGVLHGCAGPVPEPLAALTSDWRRVDLPTPLKK